MASDALEQSVLESKDKEQLVAIATALGLKSVARSKKDDIIKKILDTVGPSGGPVEAPETPAKRGPGRPPKSAQAVVPPPPAESESKPAAAKGGADVVLGADGEPLAEWEAELVRQGISTTTEAVGADGAPSGERGPRNDRGDRGDRGQQGDRGPRQHNDRNNGDRQRNFDRNDRNSDRFEGDGRNRRRRRRGKGPRDEGPQGDDRDYIQRDGGEGGSYEPVNVDVEGYLDLRDEGYGFLRVKGYLPSRDDAYVSVKQTRQYGLRKGDHVTGVSRSAGRNEKNPALVEIKTVNGGDPESAKGRPRFEDLTALFPDEKLKLENPLDPGDMTARIVDLISPIGKGQRGIIVSPPKAGKTTIMKTIATAIERNNPEVELIVLLIDERPEEVTDMKRTVRGEVISSTFDRPSDEHTHVAELAIEKAKRRVEEGKDVVVILDGITRLSRAYNLAAPASGRILSGGIDAGALYPPKKFFGAARNT
ncbi:MAG: transcription termination factor Rho, partial [Actinomycetota bacterium]|nr:transcription termination factor Rho [Actinomycetota bacterium]